MINAAEATVLTDGWRAYEHLGAVGVDHRPLVQGDPARAAAILPWIHKVFSNLKAPRTARRAGAPSSGGWRCVASSAAAP